jgi:Zn-dependent protease with chaperone function
MQLSLIVAVLAAVALGELPPGAPWGSALVRTFVSCAVMGAAPLVAWLAARRLRAVVRSGTVLRTELPRRAAAWRRAQVAVWLGAAGLVLGPLGWPQLVRNEWGCGRWILLDELLLLVPVVVPLVASWAAWFDLDAAGETTKVAPRRSPGRGEYLALHARHYLGVLLVPLLLVLGVADAVSWLWPQGSPAVGSWACCAALVGILLGFPWLLRLMWRTEPLAPGPLRERLLELGRQWGFVPREILVWHTGRRSTNAAVAGFVPGWRMVFLTDGLLARLSADEVAAVFAHEVGHVRRKHLTRRALLMGLPALGWLVVIQACPGLVAEAGAWLAALGLPAAVQSAVLPPLAVLGYGVAVLATFSRRLEMEADLWACRAADPNGHLTGAGVARFVETLEALGQAAGAPRGRGSWLHPSLGERAGFLRRAAADPPWADRFEERLRRASQLAAGLAAGAMAWLVVYGSWAGRG